MKCWGVDVKNYSLQILELQLKAFSWPGDLSWEGIVTPDKTWLKNCNVIHWITITSTTSSCTLMPSSANNRKFPEKCFNYLQIDCDYFLLGIQEEKSRSCHYYNVTMLTWAQALVITCQISRTIGRRPYTPGTLAPMSGYYRAALSKVWQSTR